MNGHQQHEKIGRAKYKARFGKLYYIEFTKGEFDDYDFTQTATTKQKIITYLGDIKDVDRSYFKYSKDKDEGFLIDFDKLRRVKKAAINDGRIGLIVAFFTDMTVVWDITKIEWEKRTEWKLVNKDGQNYGEKEWELVTYLYLDEAAWTERVERAEIVS